MLNLGLETVMPISPFALYLQHLGQTYCSEQTLKKLTCLKDLHELFEQYINDPHHQELSSLDAVNQVLSLLGNQDHKPRDGKEPLSSADAVNNEVDAQVLSQFYCQTIFVSLVAPIWAHALLRQVEANELLGSFKEALNLQLDKDLRLDRFEVDALVKLLGQCLCGYYQQALVLPKTQYRQVLDLNANPLSYEVLRQAKITKLSALVSHPNQLRSSSYQRRLAQDFSNVELQRGIISYMADKKIFFDEQGKMLVNAKPYHASEHDFYPSLTLAQAVKHFKSELIKLDVDDISYPQLLSSEFTKVIKKQHCSLMLCFNSPISYAFNLSNFTHEQFEQPAKQVAALIETLQARNPKLKLALHFDRHQLNTLVLMLSAS